MEKHVTIIPSIASANQLCIGEEIGRLEKWDRLHIDIEDGNFVPNITFGEKMIRSIAAVCRQELDAHILANHPQYYLGFLQECRVKSVAVHLEALTYPLDILNQIRDKKMHPGLALNFSTPAEDVLPFAEALDYVIVMTAEPDARGQQFHLPILNKIQRLRKLLPSQVSVWADGGIKDANLAQVAAAGADTVIMGRSIFG